MHQIGEVADAVGLSLRTIRHYEEAGLAPPSGRSAGGFRLYTDEDIERLRLIKVMKPLEFSLEEMRRLLDARDALAAAGTVRARQEIHEQMVMFVELAEERCDRLREQLAAAESLVTMLQREVTSRRPRARQR